MTVNLRRHKIQQTARTPMREIKTWELKKEFGQDGQKRSQESSQRSQALRHFSRFYLFMISSLLLFLFSLLPFLCSLFSFFLMDSYFQMIAIIFPGNGLFADVSFGNLYDSEFGKTVNHQRDEIQIVSK